MGTSPFSGDTPFKIWAGELYAALVDKKAPPVHGTSVERFVSRAGVSGKAIVDELRDRPGECSKILDWMSQMVSRRRIGYQPATADDFPSEVRARMLESRPLLMLRTYALPGAAPLAEEQLYAFAVLANGKIVTSNEPKHPRVNPWPSPVQAS